MAKHLFLTGEKQVGKSTLLQRLLEGETRRIGGFRTVKTNSVFAGHHSVHLLKIGAGEQPSEENFLFRCDALEDEKAADRFNTIGCAAIEASKHAQLIIMDELGPKETQARKFQTMVLQALEGDIPILGVLQKANSGFLNRVAMHPNVQVLEVTKENRDNFLSLLKINII